MKFLSTFLLSLCFSIVFYGQQKIKYVYVQKINDDYSIAFTKYNKRYKLYSNPVIICKKEYFIIEQYEEQSFSSKSIQLSPNKQYVVLDHISKGVVFDGEVEKPVENYHCVIVDIKHYKVVKHLQSDCDGSWNKKNEWISNNQIIFAGITSK